MSVPPYLQLPPTDRILSSRTGWTRAHWEATADRMLDALTPYATPDSLSTGCPAGAAGPGSSPTGWRVSPGRSCSPPAGSRVRAERSIPR